MGEKKKFAVSVTLQGAVEFCYTIAAENLELATREAEDRAFDEVSEWQMNDILEAETLVEPERIENGKTRTV